VLVAGIWDPLIQLFHIKTVRLCSRKYDETYRRLFKKCHYPKIHYFGELRIDKINACNWR
jgi:hypothetical protein